MCVLLSLIGCATNKYVSSCVGWLPIYLDKQDLNAISSNLAREILKHNKQGERVCVGGNMARKKTQDDIELTEAEKEILQEMIVTYQSVKMMSRLMKWIAFILFLLIIDFARLMDALVNIFTQKPNIRLYTYSETREIL